MTRLLGTDHQYIHHLDSIVPSSQDPKHPNPATSPPQPGTRALNRETLPSSNVKRDKRGERVRHGFPARISCLSTAFALALFRLPRGFVSGLQYGCGTERGREGSKVSGGGGHYTSSLGWGKGWRRGVAEVGYFYLPLPLPFLYSKHIHSFLHCIPRALRLLSRNCLFVSTVHITLTETFGWTEQTICIFLNPLFPSPLHSTPTCASKYSHSSSRPPARLRKLWWAPPMALELGRLVEAVQRP